MFIQWYSCEKKGETVRLIKWHLEADDKPPTYNRTLVHGPNKAVSTKHKLYYILL